MQDRDYFVHESSYVEDEVKIGPGTRIWYFCHIMKGAEIGTQCNLGQNVYIGKDVKIGNGCKIQNNVSVYEAVTLEDDVFLGPSMVFTNVMTPRSFIDRKHEFQPTLVKKGATIGANATILCGITIGRYAFVAAGSIVTKNVKDHELVVGNPARRSGWACVCGAKIEFAGNRGTCRSCGKHYQLNEREDSISELS